MKPHPVSVRFMVVVNSIIHYHKVNNGEITTMAAFAESIGQLPQNLNKYKYGQRVTTQIIEATCKKYKINANYLFYGKGEMFLTEPSIKRAQILKKMKELEALLK